jgi:hypothetical protein
VFGTVQRASLKPDRSDGRIPPLPERVRDFGVRRALGATTNDIVRLVLANAVGVVAPARPSD